MKRVTSIGGIFFKSKDPAATRKWYEDHLGFVTDQYGGVFEWRKTDHPEHKGYSVWNPFQEDTDYMAPSEKEFMVNFRVENLEWLLGELKKEGVEIIGEMQDYEYGKFAHIMDPNGIKIELWEPVDPEFTKMYEGRSIH